MSKENIQEIIVAPEDAGIRLDLYLSRQINNYSRSYLQKLIKEGHVVSSDGVRLTTPRYIVRAGMAIKIMKPKTVEDNPVAEDFVYDILFEDEDLLVINKPAGVVVHPAAGNHCGTVVNALLGRYPNMAKLFSGMELRPGIVHRLDKDTSGCLVIAKTPEALYKLGNAFAEHLVKKTYLAIGRGVPKRYSEELSTLIGRHPVNRQKMAIVERNGKIAITRYQVIATAMVDNIPLVLFEVNIDTGRTHQIRVHLSSIGVPVLGDDVYGGNHNRVCGVNRQLLHAWRIVFPHPISGKEIRLYSPIPKDMIDMLEKMNVNIQTLCC